MAPRRNIASFCALVCAGVVADQVTKSWACAALAHGAQTLVPGVLDLRLVMNTGAAFSIGEGSQWVFVLLALAICGMCAALVWRTHDLPVSLACSLGLVCAGGIGNLIDRVATGEVTDFFATTFMTFPVFNVADIFVTVGVILSLVLFWRWDGAHAQG